MTKEALMRKAIELSKENVENGGGPFGAVIATKDGEIVATGTPEQIIRNDRSYTGKFLKKYLEL